MYFAGSTAAATGTELWVTDGTIAGLPRKDINPTGAADSNLDYGFVVYNSELYFTASDGVSGRELWKTNGTAVGTVRVLISMPGRWMLFPFRAADFRTVNGLLVFTATTLADGDELGPPTVPMPVLPRSRVFTRKLWFPYQRYDGTERIAFCSQP